MMGLQARDATLVLNYLSVMQCEVLIRSPEPTLKSWCAPVMPLLEGGGRWILGLCGAAWPTWQPSASEKPSLKAVDRSPATCRLPSRG